MNSPYGNTQNAYKAYGNVQKTNIPKQNNMPKAPKQGYNNAQKAYQQSIHTAPSEQLVLMLYNGAIKFCNLAIEGFEKKDMVEIHINIIKVENIIMELIGSLDEQYEISKEYKRLYEYIYDCLVEANVHKDIEKLKEAKEFIIWFRDLWKEVIAKSKQNKE